MNLKLWIAQGFGVGKIPVAPGTFGSLAGLLWFALLLEAASLWVFLLGASAALALSVWLCGEAEKILGQTDPGSVVLDEIAAMPFCFVGWVGVLICKTGAMPGLDAFFSHLNWLGALGIFGAFRFFDVVKPGPIYSSQALPGGWGITVDDFLAALCVSALTLLVWGIRASLFH